MILESKNYENYDIKNPLSQKKKDEIFKPFEFKGKKNYCLITELKSTNDEDLKRYEYLDTDTIFASKMTEAYYRLEEV